MLTRWKAIFGSGPSLIVEPESSGSTVGLGERSSLRLGLTFPKRNIYDFCHLISPFELDGDGKDRLRWHIRDAMRQAIFDKRSSDENILCFAELIVLCGFNGSAREWQRVVSPKEAIELAERYYKRTTRWRKATDSDRSEEERINFSKDVYESENRIFSLFQGLRDLYAKALRTPAGPMGSAGRFSRILEDTSGLDGEVRNVEADLEAPAPAGGGEDLAGEADRESPPEEGIPGGATAVADGTPEGGPEGVRTEGAPRGEAGETGEGAAPEDTPPDGEKESAASQEVEAPPPTITEIYAHRVAVFLKYRAENAFEDAYISFREKLPKKKTRTRRVVREVASGGGGGMNLESMLALMQAMNLMQGGGKPQLLEEGKDAPAEQKKAPARKLRQTFGVKEKDRLVQLIYTCESNGVKFEKDYETLEAMVYRKPAQVVLTLSSQIDDPVFYD